MTPTGVLALIIVVRVVWVFTLLLGTAYIVFWLGFSAWWWVPSLIMIACAGSEIEVKSK